MFHALFYFQLIYKTVLRFVAQWLIYHERNLESIGKVKKCIYVRTIFSFFLENGSAVILCRPIAKDIKREPLNLIPLRSLCWFPVRRRHSSYMANDVWQIHSLHIYHGAILQKERRAQHLPSPIFFHTILIYKNDTLSEIWQAGWWILCCANMSPPCVFTWNNQISYK